MKILRTIAAGLFAAAPVSPEQASSAEPFNPTPILILGGATPAAALTWLIRPDRAATARIAARNSSR